MSATALEGVRVLDLATFIAAPFSATCLGEFGAEVIKVELPGVGDPARRFGSPSARGDSYVWLSEARNKKSLTLDLRRPEGKQICLDLVRKAHVVCENFQPGTMESWGLGYEELKKVNPSIVMLRISAYGQTGPYRDRPGFGRIANAFGGISYLAGEAGRVPVTPGSATLADYLTGLYGAFGVMVALHHAQQTGKGQFIDLALYEPVFRILDELAPAYGMEGRVRQRMGAGTVNAVPHSHYPTRDGKWVAIACTNDKIFARLAIVMARPELAAPSAYGTLHKRLADREAVDTLVAAWTNTMTQTEILDLCEEGQVPCGAILSIDEIFVDPQYRERENVVPVEVPRVGSVPFPAVVPRLSITPGSIVAPGPELGVHSDEILRELLGLSATEIAHLRDLGVT